MVNNGLDNIDEKAIETFTMMSDKDDVAEFKNVFKGKFQQDWDKIEDAYKDQDPVDGVGAPEKYLEDLFEKNRRKIES